MLDLSVEVRWDTSNTPWVLGGFLILSAIAGVLVQVATRAVARFTPPYGVAYAASLLSIVFYFLASWVVDTKDVVNPVVGLGIAMLVQSVIYGTLIRHPLSGAIGVGKGVAVTILQVAMAALLVLFAFVAASVMFP